MEDMENKVGVNASAVVNYLLQHDKIKQKLTNIHLNKIVYLIHGFCLAMLDKGIIDKKYNERVEAWMYGPVIPSIYHEFKKYGKEIIQDEAYSVVEDIEGEIQFKPNLEDSKIKAISDWVITSLILDGDNVVDARDLIDLTHKPGSPWDQVYKANLYNIEIGDDIIKEYFLYYKDYLVKNCGVKHLSV